jgi:hypothetical protein
LQEAVWCYGAFVLEPTKLPSAVHVQLGRPGDPGKVGGVICGEPTTKSGARSEVVRLRVVPSCRPLPEQSGALHLSADQLPGGLCADLSAGGLPFASAAACVGRSHCSSNIFFSWCSIEMYQDHTTTNYTSDTLSSFFFGPVMFRRHNCINVGLLPGHLLAAQVHKSFICLDDRSVCFSVHNVMTGYLVSMCGSGFDPTEFF